jgi:hypothetical protein
MSKNIMICFDGTSNHPRDAKQERQWLGFGEYKDNGITNVLKLHALFGGNLRNLPGIVDGQHSFYYSGVGTYGGKIQQLFNAGFAPSNLDVDRILRNAARDLRSIYENGDQIFLFGFSRGAAIARKFASKLDEALRDQMPSADSAQPPIRFMGVFDTVASIGMPNLEDNEKPKSDVVFEDHTISPFVREALHMVSIAENRTALLPTLMNREPRITEIWYSGAHADIGDGFWYDALSDITLFAMIRKLTGLGITVLDTDKADFANLKAPDGSYAIDFDDLYIKRNFAGLAHPTDRWGPIGELTLCQRDVRVNVGDRPSRDNPLVHETVGKRIAELTGYRPRALKGVVHDIVDDLGVVLERDVGGIRAHIHDGHRENI